LNHLPDELVRREACGYEIKRRPSLPTRIAERMAVPTLLFLKNQRAGSLDRGPAF
jgi:hypothetical protein